MAGSRTPLIILVFGEFGASESFPSSSIMMLMMMMMMLMLMMMMMMTMLMMMMMMSEKACVFQCQHV